MHISPHDARAFPELAEVVQHIGLIVLHKPKVLAAFRRFAGEAADYALIAQRLPQVRVADSFECENEGVPQDQPDGSVVQYRKMRMGFTIPSTKDNAIYVAPDIAKQAGTADGRLVLEATLLHECVHWCRMIGGEDVFSEVEPYAFEKEAYGRIVGRGYEICPPVRYQVLRHRYTKP